MGATSRSNAMRSLQTTSQSDLAGATPRSRSPSVGTKICTVDFRLNKKTRKTLLSQRSWISANTTRQAIRTRNENSNKIRNKKREQDSSYPESALERLQQVEKIPCSHAIASGTSAGTHMLSSGCKVWSGKIEEIKMAILVGAIQDERTQTPEATLEDLQLSLPEGRPVSRPGFFLPEDLQVSRPVFSLPEDLQLSRPEGRPVSRPGYFLPEDLQVSRPVFSLPEDLQLSRPEGRPILTGTWLDTECKPGPCNVFGECRRQPMVKVYSKDFLFAGYSENIYPCVGEQVEERTCFPPDVKRSPGRQKKSRWQSWLELSRMRGSKPRKQHRVYRCSKCKETGHMKPQCKSSSDYSSRRPSIKSSRRSSS
ncbi:hypothetical protein F2Q69_00054018 [Brassica cretica]|uniref:CCHC-type domain-containing protein n=1 Tax=Brassica cretica TaxID=69181 RepID=A0A8S9N0B5_BRACR|nr:hypothetical protein F2Q69_00054018 [Brassica cretica]